MFKIVKYNIIDITNILNLNTKNFKYKKNEKK